MAKIFLTGATGYIGGEVLHRLAGLRQGHRISCLIRDSAKAAVVQKAYPDARVVLGDLDNVDVIQAEATAADVVFHLASTGHGPSANAIVRGLTEKSRPKPGHWIQMSGATMVAAAQIKEGRFGEATGKSYDDIADIDAVKALISANPARVVDNLVIAQDPSSVRVALVAGPLIYGSGNGPVNQRSIQAPEIARVSLERKQVVRLGKGENVWSNVHIHDLGNLFVSLLGAAIADKSSIWDGNAIFFPGNGEMSFGELSNKIAAAASKHNWLKTTEVEQITAQEADSLSGHASAIWGTHALLTSSRAQKLLNWSPTGESLAEDIPRMVAIEAQKLGLST